MLSFLEPRRGAEILYRCIIVQGINRSYLGRNNQNFKKIVTLKIFFICFFNVKSILNFAIAKSLSCPDLLIRTPLYLSKLYAFTHSFAALYFDYFD